MENIQQLVLVDFRCLRSSLARILRKTNEKERRKQMKTSVFIILTAAIIVAGFTVNLVDRIEKRYRYIIIIFVSIVAAFVIFHVYLDIKHRPTIKQSIHYVPKEVRIAAYELPEIHSFRPDLSSMIIRY